MRPYRPREKPKDPLDNKYSVNEQIIAPQVRVIGVDGAQHGIINTREAIRLAEEQGVDLVEVAPEANPPVCRLLDFGKLKYRETVSQGLDTEPEALIGVFKGRNFGKQLVKLI